MEDAQLLASMDESVLEVADAGRKLCRLAACPHVWGLPHVLRCVSKDGVRIVEDVCCSSLPDSLLPGPMPFSAGSSCSVQVLASVAGATAAWRPTWMEFPELVLRADVVVRAARIEEALAQFSALLASDVADLEALPVLLVEGLRLMDPCSSSHGELWTPSDIVARPEEWRRTLASGMLSGRGVELRAVLMLDAPPDAQHIEVRSSSLKNARALSCCRCMWRKKAHVMSCSRAEAMHILYAPHVHTTRMYYTCTRRSASCGSRCAVSGTHCTLSPRLSHQVKQMSL
jgi:hypothetical protein